MKIGRIVMGVCQTNCYFLYEEGKKEVIFVDPADRGEMIYQKLTEAGFSVAGIILTHGHFDHILGAEKLRQLSGAKIYALEDEKKVCEDAHLNLSGQFGKEVTIQADEYVKDQAEITIAGMTAKVFATPGHTCGSCCYYFEAEKLLISGDTLFQESVGRTDFATGSYSQIVRSIRERLMPLPDEVKVYPGHGDETSIGHERQYNPFIAD